MFMRGTFLLARQPSSISTRNSLLLRYVIQIAIKNFKEITL